VKRSKILIKSLVFVAGNAVLSSIILDNGRLDHKVAGNYPVRPTIFQEFYNCFSHAFLLDFWADYSVGFIL
jgi:hypothetical protein